ncbi:peptidase inhibitor family I36 protein [Streptomyces sp. NPDC086766]|uniref:peptidase inhibitor family I36 protein n=1 Tax=Streptomyces sp. NPDC086766 TaxID=3365754 RepID=UPI0038258E82
MNARRRIAVGLLSAAFVSSTVVLAEPASAGEYCSSGYHCVFYADIGTSKHSYFDSDSNFTNDYFGNGAVVNDNFESASNSSTGGYESHYYYDINYGGGLVFCVNPGHTVHASQLTNDWVAGNHSAQQNEGSSLRLRPTTTITCF